MPPIPDPSQENKTSGGEDLPEAGPGPRVIELSSDTDSDANSTIDEDLNGRQMSSILQYLHVVISCSSSILQYLHVVISWLYLKQNVDLLNSY